MAKLNSLEITDNFTSYDNSRSVFRPGKFSVVGRFAYTEPELSEKSDKREQLLEDAGQKLNLGVQLVTFDNK